MSKSAPSPPDPVETAQAQAAANKEAVYESARVNQFNQVSPFGSLTYTGEIGSPGRTSTTALAPEARAVYDRNLAIAKALADFGVEYTPQVAAGLSQPRTYTGAPGERERIEAGLMERLDPYLRRDEDRRRAQLAAQGITLGSEAWGNAEQDLARGRNDARLAVIGQAGGEYQRGAGMEAALRSQAINELAALLQGSPAIGTPTFGAPAQYQLGSPDVIGLAQSNYQNQLGSYNANLGGMYGLGSALIGGGLGLFSPRP